MIYGVKHGAAPAARLARPGRLAIVGCALVAVGFLLVWIGGVADPVRMPTSPAPVTAGAAIAAAALIGTANRSWLPVRPLHLLLTGLAGAAMLAGTLFALPHTVMLAVAWVGVAVTGGIGPFEAEPSWSMTAVHLTNLVASGAVLAWLLWQYRRTTHRCTACGRVANARPAAPASGGAARWQRLRVLAALTIVASLPYAGFKVAWSAGAMIGLVGPGFDDVGFTSPGFGDTVLLTGISVAACLVMGSGLSGTNPARRLVRRLVLSIGTLGSLMLLPVGAVALGQLAPVALGRASIDDSVIAPWAFVVVYLSFVIWGVALAALTLRYRSATRPPCPHHRAQAIDTSPAQAIPRSTPIRGQ